MPLLVRARRRAPARAPFQSRRHPTNLAARRVVRHFVDSSRLPPHVEQPAGRTRLQRPSSAPGLAIRSGNEPPTRVLTPADAAGKSWFDGGNGRKSNANSHLRSTNPSPLTLLTLFFLVSREGGESQWPVGRRHWAGASGREQGKSGGVREGVEDTQRIWRFVADRAPGVEGGLGVD